MSLQGVTEFAFEFEDRPIQVEVSRSPLSSAGGLLIGQAAAIHRAVRRGLATRSHALVVGHGAAASLSDARSR